MKGNLIGWRMHCLTKSWTFFNSCCKQSMKRNAREPNGATIQFGKGWRHPIQSEWGSVNPDGSTHSNAYVWMLCKFLKHETCYTLHLTSFCFERCWLNQVDVTQKHGGEYSKPAVKRMLIFIRGAWGRGPLISFGPWSHHAFWLYPPWG